MIVPPARVDLDSQKVTAAGIQLSSWVMRLFRSLGLGFFSLSGENHIDRTTQRKGAHMLNKLCSTP